MANFKSVIALGCLTECLRYYSDLVRWMPIFVIKKWFEAMDTFPTKFSVVSFSYLQANKISTDISSVSFS